MLSGALGTILLSTGGWWHPGASLDADFAGGRLFGASDFASAFPITRASVGYADDSVGNWTQFGNGLLRRTNRGLLPEEARTNSIRNNSMQGAVAGTPGTLPNNWTVTSSVNGLTREVVGVGTENGIDYIDVKWSGTASASSDIDIQFESATGIAAVNGQTWTGSIFAKLVNGSIPNTALMYAFLYDSGPAFIGSILNTAPLTVTNVLTRFAQTGTIAAATTASIRPLLKLAYTNGQVVNFTLRIGWPQLELGAFATSPIRTTSAAATKAADAVLLNNLTNYLSLAQGSVFVEWEDVGPVGTTRMLFSQIVDTNNRIYSYVSSGDRKVYFQIVTGGVTQAVILSTNAVVAGGRYKIAVAWENNRAAMRLTSSLGSPANDTSTPNGMPVGTPVFGIGSNGVGGAYFNSYIRRLATFKSPLSDAQLTAMVA